MVYLENLLIVFRGANKQDEALECYGRAANLYKMAKKWSLAGQTFVTIATHHSKVGGKHDAATNFVDAANCFKKSDPKGKMESCYSCLYHKISLYTYVHLLLTRGKSLLELWVTSFLPD